MHCLRVSRRCINEENEWRIDGHLELTITICINVSQDREDETILFMRFSCCYSSIAEG